MTMSRPTYLLKLASKQTRRQWLAEKRLRQRHNSTKFDHEMRQAGTLLLRCDLVYEFIKYLVSDDACNGSNIFEMLAHFMPTQQSFLWSCMAYCCKEIKNMVSKKICREGECVTHYIRKSPLI